VVSGVEIECEIVDTAGLDEYSRVPKDAAVGVHGYVLVYDMTSRISFEKVRASKRLDLLRISSSAKQCA